MEGNLMIMKNLGEEHDQLQESFSFTSFDLKSSISLFSDNDDEDDEETYIEIALEQPLNHGQPHESPTATCPAGEVELRVSFDQSRKRVSFRNKSSTPSSPPRSMKTAIETTRDKGHFVALDRLLNVFMAALKGSSLKNQEDKGLGGDNDNRQLSVNSGGWKLVKSRKTPKVMTTTNNRAMKFLIKFQSINIRSMLTPILKPRQRSRQTNMYLTNGEQSSRTLGLNLDSIKGVLETITTRTKRGGKQQTKIRPSSTKSSPTHGIDTVSSGKKCYSRENSVQGAIAHCKRSFTPDGGW